MLPCLGEVFPSLPVGMAASFRLRAPGPVMVAASRETSGEVTVPRQQAEEHGFPFWGFETLGGALQGAFRGYIGVFRNLE